MEEISKNQKAKDDQRILNEILAQIKKEHDKERAEKIQKLNKELKILEK